MFFIHWRLQRTKIFYHEQFHMKISNSEFFPNYGININAAKPLSLLQNLMDFLLQFIEKG